MIYGFLRPEIVSEVPRWVVVYDRVGSIAITAILMFRFFQILQQKILGRYLSEIVSVADNLFFYGFKISRYMENGAFLRLQGWLGSGICYELSALAMIMLKDFPSAELCRGVLYDKNGKFVTKHSWVEVKAPLGGCLVVDMAWFMPSLCEKKEYFNLCTEEGGRFVTKWRCSYDDFWKNKYPWLVYKAIQNMGSSYVLPELTVFGNARGESYEFKNTCIESDELRFSKMVYEINFKGKHISPEILTDFVKNDRRKQPRKRSLRITQAKAKRYSQT